MKHDYKTIVFLILFLAGAATVRAQNKTLEKMEHQIEQKLQYEFKQKYFVVAYNKKLSKSWVVKKGFYDPYGTLKDAFIFTAIAPIQKNGTQPNSFIGVYKNGKIIWQSKSEIPPSVDAEIPIIKDLNNDGRVDIVTQWNRSMRGGYTGLWIYSWDGQTGERTNRIVKGGYSNIKINDYSLQFVDIQPDGILEITGKNLENKTVVYSWNGKAYVNLGDSLPHPLPRNRVKAELHARVTSSNDHLQFHYQIHVKKNSLQSLEQFAVKNYSHKEPIHDIKPAKWYFSHLRHRLVTWQISPMFDPILPNVLHPGDTDSLFVITSTGLPRPGTFYLKGNNGNISVNTEDLVTNSVKGTTLCPYDPPDPFDAVAFTNRFLSFTSQACNLKWIDNKGICQSLQAKLKNVQKQISKGKTKTAINDLQAFLNEVEAQKGKHLTGEGYGLLYFNGVYLLKKLRE
jgi:hypothetical protein